MNIQEARRSAPSIRLLGLLLICVAAVPGTSWAQTAPVKSGAANSPPSQNKDGGGALGFSIESEMLTYRALESNSEAVACDVAAYLRGGSTTFRNPPAGSVCTIRGGTDNQAGIIILPFDPTQLNEFRMWRADMLVMSELRARAETFCPANQPTEVTDKGSVATPKSAASSLLGATPAGSALSLVQTGLGLLSSQSSATPVGGTIQDQAFMDAVARNLRSLMIPVLMPSTFLPGVLTPIDRTRSPFLQSLDKLYSAHRCLLGKTSERDPAIAQLVADIDSYLAAVTESPTVKVESAPGSALPPKSRSTVGSSAAQAGGTDTGTQTPDKGGVAPAESNTHLMSILSADSLAQRLGVDPQTGHMPANGSSQHVLLLKALESGGAVEKDSNILGTKTHYSGGSVGTYALFTLNGDLECSGNVYEYGGMLPAKDFEKGLRDYVPDPGKQYIFQRESCQPPH